jgi:tetratricopeptide (TPR) repeat protein
MRPVLPFLLLACALLGAQDQPIGQLLSRIACRDKPAFSYALYLPTAYSKERPCPVLFAFSPVGDGEQAIRPFLPTAERLGYILVGSNDARNGPKEPIRQAQDALWKEITTRYAVNKGYCVSTGFSGGARMALDMAHEHARSFVGVISLGAFGTGQPEDLSQEGLAHALVAGREDYNALETIRARERLRAGGRPCRLDIWSGAHTLPPDELVNHALEWVDLVSGPRRGKAGPEAARRSTQEMLAGAQEAERQGLALEALRRYEDLLATDPGSPGVRERIKALEADPALKPEQLAERHAWERAKALWTSRSYGADLSQLARDRDGKGPEALAARRVLNLELGHIEEGVVVHLTAQRWAEALPLAQNLAVLADRHVRGHIYAAMALAQLGRRAEAIEYLREARARDPKRLAANLSHRLLEPLKDETAFQALRVEAEKKGDVR